MSARHRRRLQQEATDRLSEDSSDPGVAPVSQLPAQSIFAAFGEEDDSTDERPESLSDNEQQVEAVSDAASPKVHKVDKPRPAKSEQQPMTVSILSPELSVIHTDPLLVSERHLNA